jgi:cellulose synthase operon protein C
MNGRRHLRKRQSLFLLAVLLTASPLSAGAPASPATQPNDLVEMSRRGKQAMADGKYEEAIVIFKGLVQALPEEPALRVNLGIAHYMAGQHEQAIVEFEAASKRRANLVPELFFLGAAYLKTGSPEHAVAPLEKVLTAEPGNSRALHMLADALLSSARYKQAASRFLALTEVDAANPKAWHGLGQSYEALSSEAFQRLQDIESASPYVSLLRAQALFQQKRYSRALRLYREALTKLPGHRGVHEDVAEIYRETGHLEWANHEEAKARRLQPPDCSSPSVECLFQAGRYQEVVVAIKGDQSPVALYWLSRAYGRLATTAFSRLGQLPPSAEMHQVTAEAYSAQGRAREAVEEWRQALKYEPESVTLRKGLAESLYLTREFEAAKAVLLELLRLHSKSARLNLMYGGTLLELYQPEEAIPYLRQAAELDPTLVSARALLGRAYLRSGQAERAISHLKAALNGDEDGQIHYQLATAYKRTGQEMLADQILQRYREILAAVEVIRQEQEQAVKITPPW